MQMVSELKAEKSAVKVMERVEQYAVTSLDKRPRVIDKIDIGQYFEQGDVTIFRVANNHPRGEELLESSGAWKLTRDLPRSGAIMSRPPRPSAANIVVRLRTCRSTPPPQL